MRSKMWAGAVAWWAVRAARLCTPTAEKYRYIDAYVHNWTVKEKITG